jgi:hypothetical protein
VYVSYEIFVKNRQMYFSHRALDKFQLVKDLLRKLKIMSTNHNFNNVKQLLQASFLRVPVSVI